MAGVPVVVSGGTAVASLASSADVGVVVEPWSAEALADGTFGGPRGTRSGPDRAPSSGPDGRARALQRGDRAGRSRRAVSPPRRCRRDTGRPAPQQPVRLRFAVVEAGDEPDGRRVRRDGRRRGPATGWPIARIVTATESSGWPSPGHWRGCRHRHCRGRRPEVTPRPFAPPRRPARGGSARRVRDTVGRGAQAGRYVLLTRAWSAAISAALEPVVPLDSVDIWQSEGMITLPVALRLRGRHGGRVVYDSRDIHLQSARFALLPGPWRRLLARRERAWAQAADAVVTVNKPVCPIPRADARTIDDAGVQRAAAVRAAGPAREAVPRAARSPGTIRKSL